MVQISGKYKNTRCENIDEHFAAIGVPWIARKLMNTTYPTIEIQCEDGKWTITTATLMSKNVAKFRLNEEYEETMFNGSILKNVTRQESESTLITKSVGPRGNSERVMEFSDDGMVLTMKHEKTTIEAKRFFSRE